MAVLAVSALGAAVGGTLITGTFLGLSGAAIGWTVGGLLGSALFPQKAQGPRLGDLRVAGSEYGQPIPWVTCSPRLAGQIVWASNKRETATTQSAGKGGGPEVTTYTYDVDLVILLSENPIGGVGRIWSNGDLVYNGEVTRSGIWNGLSIYLGADDQLPDPTYEAGVGSGNAPAYRGRGYVVISGLQLGQSGQIPNLTFEISGVDTSDYVLWAPYTDGLEDTDLVNPPEGFETFTGNASYTDEGLFLVASPTVSLTGQATYKRENDGGKIKPFLVGSGSYITFDYKLSSPVGTGDMPNRATTLFEYGNISASVQFVDDSLVFGVGGLFIIGVTPPVGFSYANFPTEGNLVLKFTNASPQDVEFYLNGNLIGTVTGWFYQTTFSFGFNSQLGSPVGPTGPYIPSYTISNFVFGIGDPPIRTRFTKDVSVVTRDLMIRAGYSVNDYDVSGISEYDKPVRALAVGQVSNTRSILEQLQGAFFFEASKSDKIYFRKRSSSAVATIPFADLRASDSPESQDEPFPLNTAGDLEIPAQASLTYPNMAADYNNATEYSFRVNSAQDSVEAVSTALGMLPDEAKGVIDALLVERVASQTKSTIKVGLEYAYIEPGDVINVTNDDGRVYRMRVGTKKDNLTTIELELVLDDVGAIDFSAITADDYVLTDDVKQVAPTFWEVLDIPLLRDADNENGYYVAIAPDYTAGDEIWDGAVFLRKWTIGDFENRFISADVCVVGTCQTTLGNWTGGNVFDESNSVTVRVTGELSSTTRSAMLDSVETNIAIVGNEIIRFRLATFVQNINGEKEYVLTGLLRGQRGTEQYQTGHTSNERFVLLNTQLRNVIDQNSQIDLPSEVKAVTLNLPLSSVTEEAFTNTAVRLKPFSVVQLRALADGSDLEVSWNRRTRLSYRYGGTIGTSVPLGEAIEAYRVRIYDGSTLVRTVDVTSPSYTYSAANIAADGFSSGATATIEVVQLSEIVGEGFPTEVNGVIP